MVAPESRPAARIAVDAGATAAGPESSPGLASEARLVEVAVDAPGAGSRTYSYHLPVGLGDVGPGEAVLVEYGRRQALGIVVAVSEREPAGGPGEKAGGEVGKGAGGDRATKPVLARIRADGPLLPPLSLALARWISSHYLAPPALALRAMLPPGLLERLELMADAQTPPASTPSSPGVLPSPEMPSSEETPAQAGDEELLDQVRREPRAVRDLAGGEGRAALLRRLRTLEARGLVRLEWTLTAATGGPRYERWALLEEAGRAAAISGGAGPAKGARPLGPRQRDALAELVAADGAGIRTAELADRHGASAVASLERRGLIRSDVRERPRIPLADRPAGRRGARPADASLSTEQADAVRGVREAIAKRDPTPLLLDGVTGGGKTAIYVESIAASIEAGRPALVLVPEIALALPLIDRLRAELEARIAIVHSALGDGERADEWRRIRAGGVDIVVGTRLAALSPLPDVGLVVVDEEHDPAYKSDRTPRLQARDTAIRLAQLAGAAVILGSATPAVDSLGRARSGEYRSARLPDRPTGSLPTVEIVDLRAELAEGNRSVLSRSLATALGALDPECGERAILVMNRRGSASVVLCRDCGHVQICPECQRPLVFHQAGVTLRCHQCGTASPLARRCPSCRSPRIRYLGGGTERIEAEVKSGFPQLRVGRLDRDVVERKGAAARVVDAFAEGRLDVLVGTSLVTKGLDIPEVTLVGVVSADVALNLPDERAAERTYQLLAQAVGRAGRGDLPGRAIVQTYQPEHPAIRAVASGDASTFYDAELDLRRRFGSPPFGRLVKLTVGLPDAAAAERTAAEMAERLRVRARERGQDLAVLGPAPAYTVRRAGRWRWNLVLRGQDPAAILDGGLPAPWSVDVDPESLL